MFFLNKFILHILFYLCVPVSMFAYHVCLGPLVPMEVRRGYLYLIPGNWSSGWLGIISMRIFGIKLCGSSAGAVRALNH